MTEAANAALVTALEDAASEGTGCLYVADSTGTRSGRVFFRDAKVYSASVDGFMPKVAQRLHTGGMLSDDQFRTLLAAVDGNPYAPSLGILAVEHGFIDEDMLNAVLREILLSSVGAMLAWNTTTAKFKRDQSTDQFVIPEVTVKAIVKAVAKRRERWEDLWAQVAPGMKPDETYPVVVGALSPEEEMSSEVAAVLAASTGAHSVDDVAGACGLTRFETGHVLGHLVSAGVISMQAVPAIPQTADQPARHGTAETATMDPDDAPARDLDESERDTEHLVPPELAGVNFAPDVISTVVATAPEDDEEPSAFEVVEEDALPDGMDLGTMPNEQIENDDLDGLEVVAPPVASPVAPPVVAPDFVAPPVGTVDATGELPRFTEPVAPVAPVGHLAPSSTSVAPPPGIPVFVDAAALDLQRTPSEAVVGLPGVPPSDHPVAPVPLIAPVAAEDDAGTGGSAENDAPQPHDQTEDSDFTDDEPSEETEHGDDLDVTAPDEPSATAAAESDLVDPRVAAARHRLVDEIAFATEFAATAENALARAEQEHAANTEAAEHNANLLNRYRDLLREAEEEKQQLEAESERVATAVVELVEAAQVADRHIEDAEAAVSDAADRVARAREALEAAQAELVAAEDDLTATQHERDNAIEAQSGQAAQRAQLVQAVETLDQDVAELTERIGSYAAEVEECEQMAASLASAQEHASTLKEAAAQRLASAQRNVAAKQERLRQLDASA